MAGTPLATAFVRVKPAVDRAAFKSETDRAVKGSGLGKAGAQQGKLFGSGFVRAATAGFALLGGVQIFRTMFAGAEESARVGALTAAVIKSTGGAAKVTAKHVQDLANAMMANTGVDDEAIKSGQNMLLTFTNIRNEAGKNNAIFDQASTVLLDMTAAMNGGQVTEENMRKQAIQLGKALQDPVKGATALRRVGVMLTDQQKEQIAAFVKSGDIMSAQKVILRELGREFGGAAVAATTPSQRLKTALGELAESAGTALLPAFTKVSAWLVNTGIPALTKFGSWVGKNKNWLIPLAGAVGTFAGSLYLAAKALGVAQAAMKLFGITSTLSLGPIGLIITGLAALGVGLYLLWTRSATFRRIVTGVWNAVLGVFKAVFGWVKVNWPLLLGILTGPIGLAAVAIGRHWGAIKSGAAGAFNAVVGWFRSLPGRILGAIGKVGALLWGTGRQILTGLWNGLISIWNGIIGWFKGLPGRILNALGIHSPPKWAVDAGKHILTGLFGWTMGKKHEIITRFSTLGATVGGAVASSAAQMIAASMLPAYGWGKEQLGALIALWQGESGWRWNATNPTSGAYGIPQALPASKMASAGGDWRTNPATQIRWGLGYIKAVYGTPGNAYSAWLSRWPHWYGSGGLITEPILGVGRSGRMYGFGERGPETVIPGRGGGNTYQFYFSGPVASREAAKTMVLAAMRDLQRERRLP